MGHSRSGQAQELALQSGQMGSLRFFRRVPLTPGLRLNFSKSGPSLSLGVRGAHVTFGRRGVRRTLGVPGTGMFYTSQRGWHSGVHSAPEFAQRPSGVSRGGSWRVVAWLVFALVVLAVLGQAFGR